MLKILARGAGQIFHSALGYPSYPGAGGRDSAAIQSTMPMASSASGDGLLSGLSPNETWPGFDGPRRSRSAGWDTQAIFALADVDEAQPSPQQVAKAARRRRLTGTARGEAHTIATASVRASMAL